MKPIVVLEDGTSRFRGYAPRPPLDRDVSLIWLIDGVTQNAGERVLPNGAVEVILNFGTSYRVLESGVPSRFSLVHRAWIAGIQSAPLDFEAERDTSLVGIRFRPGGAEPFVGVPMHALRDQVVELELVARDLARDLHGRLSDARSDAEKVGLVEAAIIERRRTRARDRRVLHACASLAAAGDRKTVGAVAGELGISHKHLVDLFAREVGLSPKMWARVMRFQAVLRALDGAESLRLADLAQDLGFTDQAHLAGEFRALAGTTVTNYLRDRSMDPNHVLLL